MATTALVMIDGLRPDALSAAGTPNLWQFKAEGAASLTAQSVMPSITLPCHTSIFHSVPPTRHGIVSNDWNPMARPLPGLIEVATNRGLECAFFYSWEQLRDMSRPGHLTYSICLNTAERDMDTDTAVAAEALRHLSGHRIDFAFVYLGTVDTAGHRFGWMSEGYLAQVSKVDAAFGALLAGLPDDTSILVQSDHGGHDRSHGTEMAEDMTIPWLVRGPDIRQGHEIETPVSLLDTAPTLARLLQIKPDRRWEGRCVDEIFIAEAD